MDAKELFALMDDADAKARQPKCVLSLYASRLAVIQHKLSAEELADMLEMGVVIGRRTSMMVPVLRAECVGDWPITEGKDGGAV